MKQKVLVNWKDEMSFEAEVDHHKVMMDAGDDAGGHRQGPRPKPLTLAALGGCTGMDVISILKKMKITPEAYSMQIEAETSEEHPKVYRSIHITYIFKGEDLPLDKLQKAVNLSQEKYCAVSAMLGKAARIDYSIEVQ